MTMPGEQKTNHLFENEDGDPMTLERGVDYQVLHTVVMIMGLDQHGEVTHATFTHTLRELG